MIGVPPALAQATSTPAAAISVLAAAVVTGATPAQSAVRTLVLKPPRALSRAAARTQWSVAIPHTSISDTWVCPGFGLTPGLTVLGPRLRLGRELVRDSLAATAVVLGFDPGHDRETEFLTVLPTSGVEHVLLRQAEEGLLAERSKMPILASHCSPPTR